MPKTNAFLAMTTLSLGAFLAAGCQPPATPPAARSVSANSSLTTDGDQPAREGRPVKEANIAKAEAAKTVAEPGSDVLPISLPKAGEWNQWGGSPLRNNTPEAKGIVIEFAAGDFDRKSGAWKKDKAKNIKWVSSVGSQTYGNTVVAAGKVFVGTNNSFGYLTRYPADVDLGCLVCFDEKDGKFLWQHSSEKLPTGRVNDWPLMGICCSPLVEGDKLWFVTSRGEVRCLDTEGFYDGEDDGPVKSEPARLFDIMKAEDPAEDKVQPIIDALDGGKLPDDVRARFETAGVKLAGDVAVAKDDTAKAPAKKWKFQTEVDGKQRDFFLTVAGPRLSGFKIMTPEDKQEADVIWVFDMMKTLGTSQHNMCSC